MHLSPAEIADQEFESAYNSLGLAELMTRAFKGEDLSETATLLMERAQNSDDNALLDLSIVLQLQGHRETGISLQKEALKQQQLFHIHPSVKKSNLKLLAIFAPGDLMTNTPLEFLAQGAGFCMDILYVSPELALPEKLPEHDIAIVGISELDRNFASFQCAENLRPLIQGELLNPPANITRLSRDSISQRLQNIDGIEIPITERISRAELLALSSDQALKATIVGNTKFPIIIRPIDSHAGQDLARVDDLPALHQYLDNCTSQMFFIAPFINYRSEDGKFKKYRIMLIDGKPYIAHMAVSEHWMIHYLNADMLEHAERRFAEAQAMGGFEQGFAKKHSAAFQALADKVGLSYFGIDCGESQDGKLLIFEACASLNVHAMDCEKTFPYKKPQMQKIFDGFLQMLVDKSKTGAAQ